VANKTTTKMAAATGAAAAGATAGKAAATDAVAVTAEVKGYAVTVTGISWQRGKTKVFLKEAMHARQDYNI